MSQPQQQSPEGGDGGDIHQVVQQHGPAQEVHIKHDEASGQHHMHSTHGAHKHHSSHGSKQEAHQAGMTAAGADGADEQQSKMGNEMGGSQPMSSALPGY